MIIIIIITRDISTLEGRVGTLPRIGTYYTNMVDFHLAPKHDQIILKFEEGAIKQDDKTGVVMCHSCGERLQTTKQESKRRITHLAHDGELGHGHLASRLLVIVADAFLSGTRGHHSRSGSHE